MGCCSVPRHEDEVRPSGLQLHTPWSLPATPAVRDACCVLSRPRRPRPPLRRDTQTSVRAGRPRTTRQTDAAPRVSLDPSRLNPTTHARFHRGCPNRSGGVVGQNGFASLFRLLMRTTAGRTFLHVSCTSRDGDGEIHFVSSPYRTLGAVRTRWHTL